MGCAGEKPAGLLQTWLFGVDVWKVNGELSALGLGGFVHNVGLIKLLSFYTFGDDFLIGKSLGGGLRWNVLSFFFLFFFD